MFRFNSWFEEVFGLREKTNDARNPKAYQEMQEAFTYDPATGKLVVQGWNEFMAGRFRTPSLEELRSAIDLEAARDPENKPIIVRQEVSDVSELHEKAENRFAVFQAASQFNALEFPSQAGVPEHGITCYQGDRTQGPACAIACAPGTVVRNYLAFDGLGQTEGRQVGNLAEVEEVLENKKHKFFRVLNGYTMAEDTGLWRLSKMLEEGGLELCE